MTDLKLTQSTREIDMDALDPEVRKTYPRFVKRHKRWLVAVPKSYEAKTGEYIQVLRSNGTVRIVELQDKVLFEPYNMKRGTKDVFLCNDATGLIDGGYVHNNCHVVLLDGTGRCDPEICFKV